MVFQSDIHEDLLPLLNLVGRLEENRILRDFIFEMGQNDLDGLAELIERELPMILSAGSNGESVNVLPREFGVSGTCKKLLMVIVYASNRRATGKNVTKVVPAGDFEELMNAAANHLKNCSETKGVVFWSISSWHPYIWLKHQKDFRHIPVAVKIVGSAALMI